MRRESYATLFIFGCAILLLGDVALAQIQFVPRPSIPVPRGPAFADIGDLDNDGIEDVVVTTIRDDGIVTLFGDESGQIRDGIRTNIGRAPQGLTVLDFNGDGNLDVAVTDRLGKKLNLRGAVFAVTGNGDGTFVVDASSSQEVPLGTDQITFGDFDNQRGPDLATVNAQARVLRNTVTVLLNRGGNLGYEDPIILALDGKPDDIEAADFNGDGLDDLAVLDTISRFAGADSVQILINQGLGGFDPALARNFVVGIKAAYLEVGDFNNDGVPDIIVVNQGAQTADPRRFSISVLLNRTTEVDGELKGTGFFNILSEFPFNCPTLINGIPVLCTARDLAIGDFDLDGVLDFAVSMSTLAQREFNDFLTPGLVMAFTGLGNGFFEFSTQVQVGVQPRGLGVGDLNGDGLADIAVTEFADHQVRALIAVKPPPRENGDTCLVAAQCESGACVDGRCCSSASCPFDQRCDIPGNEGECSNPADDGSRCTVNEHCLSLFCVDGVCCNVPVCPEGEFCITGQCGPPAPPGFPCNSDEQCESGFCTDGFCCTARECPFGQRCDIPGNEGVCSSKLPIGAPCEQDDWCQSDFCTDGFCCGVDECAQGFSCGVPGFEGFCSRLPTPTPTPTRTTTPTLTPTPQPNGFPCGSGEECISTFCVDGVCCSSASCPIGEFCNLPDNNGFVTGDCRAKKEIGEGCNVDSDCLSGNCELGSNPNPNFAGLCAPARTPTPTPLRGPGEPCGADSECQAGFFCNDLDGVCCNRELCPEGQSCKIPGHFGFCTNLPTPTPTRRPLGSPCNASVPQQCESDNCWTDSPATDLGTCCSTPECPEDQRCDITGEEGNCFPQRNEGDECGKASDCEPGLLCLFNPERNKFLCTVARPTATPITPPPSTPTPQFTVRISRSSGGCAIDPQGGAAGAWVLALLPLFLGIVRRQQLRSGNRGQRQ